MEASTRRWSSQRRTLGLVGVCTVLAAAVRLVRLAVPGYLYGPVGYDEGVYFGDAVRVVHGHLPYRDFIAVHPPGIMELLAPVAASADVLGTSRAFAIARVLTALAGAASVLVVGLLMRQRGALATTLVCALVAVHPGSVNAANGVLLEPWLVLFCLLGLLIAFDGERLASPRRLFGSGLLLGVAGAIKIWAIGPAAVLAVVSARRPRCLERFVTGVVVGFAATVAPFAALAPGAFFHEVVDVQLTRGGPRTPTVARLRELLGASALGLPAWMVWLLAAGVVTLVAGTVVLTRRVRPMTQLEIAGIATAAVTTAMLLAPPLFLPHYAAFCVPFAALALSRAVPVEREYPARREPARASRALCVVLACGVLGAAGSQLRTSVRLHPLPNVVTAVRSAIPAGACVVTNDPSATLAADRFVPANGGCPDEVDFYGARIDLNGTATSGQYTAPFQHFWADALSGAQYLLLQDIATNPSWRPDVLHYFRAHFALVRRFHDGTHRFYLFRHT